MKVKYVRVHLKKEGSNRQYATDFIFDENMVGVDDLHIITREGFVTVNHLGPDGTRQGKTWPASSVQEITTVL